MIKLSDRPAAKPGRPKKPPKVVVPRWQASVYLGEDDFKRLLAIAKRESRSTNMQIQYFVREGMARYLQRDDLPDE